MKVNVRVLMSFLVGAFPAVQNFIRKQFYFIKSYIITLLFLFGFWILGRGEEFLLTKIFSEKAKHPKICASFGGNVSKK